MITDSAETSQQIALDYAKSNVVGSEALQSVATSLISADFPGALFAFDLHVNEICAAAPDWRQWYRLAPLLEATIGHTLSDFPKQAETTSAPARLTALLGGFSPALWCRIRLADDIRLKQLAIDACTHLVVEFTAHADLVAPPKPHLNVGQLMALFERALDRGDFERAGNALSEMQVGNHLDAANSRFLRLRWLHAQGESRRCEAQQLAGQIRGLAVPREVRRLLDLVQ
jgi:hypothetical protein